MNDKKDTENKDAYCPTCGRPIDIFEEEDVLNLKNYAPQEPPKITYYSDHQIFIRMPGDMNRIEAARKAIGMARGHMESLPEGFKLRQACPRRYIDYSGKEPPYWIVRCIAIRASDKLDGGWEDLLDMDDIYSVNAAAMIGRGM